MRNTRGRGLLLALVRVAVGGRVGVAMEALAFDPAIVTQLRSAPTVVEGANLAGANLVGADLHGMLLDRVDLRGANLVGANMTGVNLTDANLTHTIMPDGTRHP